MAPRPPDRTGDQADRDGKQHELVDHEDSRLDALHDDELAQQVVGAVGDEAVERVDMPGGVEDEAERGDQAEHRRHAGHQHDLDREGKRTAGDIGHEIKKGRPPHPALQGPLVPVVLGQMAGQHDDGDVDQGTDRLDRQHVPAGAAAIGKPPHQKEGRRRGQQERQAGQGRGQDHPEDDDAQRNAACLEGEGEAVHLLFVQSLAPARRRLRLPAGRLPAHGQARSRMSANLIPGLFSTM